MKNCKKPLKSTFFCQNQVTHNAWCEFKRSNKKMKNFVAISKSCKKRKRERKLVSACQLYHVICHCLFNNYQMVYLLRSINPFLSVPIIFMFISMFAFIVFYKIPYYHILYLSLFSHFSLSLTLNVYHTIFHSFYFPLLTSKSLLKHQHVDEEKHACLKWLLRVNFH